MARVEICFFFIFCEITRGNKHRSCVTKSVLLLPEYVPSVHVAQVIVMVRILYPIMGVFSNFGKRGIIFKYLVMVVMRGPNSQTHNMHPPPWPA